MSRPSRAGSAVTALAGFLVLFMAGAYWLARTGFEQPLSPILRIAGLGLFVVAACELVPRPSEGPPSWFRSEGWLGLVPLLLAVASSPLGSAAGLVLALLGVAGFGVALLRTISRAPHRLSVLLVALVLSFWCVGLAWSHGYASPLFLESLATGTAPQTVVDTLFHTAISNMLDGHGVSATGLDGVAPLSYHVGSHWLLATSAGLAGVRPFEFYQLGFPVVFLPALLASPFRFALSLPGAFGVEPRPAFWWALPAAVIGVVPLSALRGMAIGWWRPISESYAVSLVLAFGLASAVVALCHGGAWREPRLRDWRSLVFLLGVGPLGVSVIGVTKSSTMLMLVAALVWTFLRKRLFASWAWCASTALTSALALATLWAIRIPEFAQPSLLYFWRAYVHPDWLPLWPLGYFATFWLLAVLKLRGVRQGIDARAFVAAWRTGKLFELELLALLALVSCVPDALLAIPGQSGGYFSDVPRWLALGLLLALLIPGTEAATEVVAAKTPWREQPLAWWASRVTLLLLGAVCVTNTALLTGRFVAANLKVRRALVPTLQGTRQLLGRSPALVAAQKEHRALAFLHALRTLDAPTTAGKAKTLLLASDLPQELQAALAPCKRPFLLPAISGLAALAALPSSACPFFGYWSYRNRPEGWDGPGAGLPPCERARRLGFERIARLGRDEAGYPRVDSLDCRAGQ